jgi:hypothetical protein
MGSSQLIEKVTSVVSEAVAKKAQRGDGFPLPVDRLAAKWGVIILPARATRKFLALSQASCQQ